jgi:ribose transport system substrate-binding protein
MKDLVGFRNSNIKFGTILVFLLVVAVVVVGCVAYTKNQPSEAVVEEPTVREGTYYFLAANNSDPFYIPGVKGFTDAANAVGMKSEFVGPMDANTSAQMKTFEELVANPNTKGIFWYPADFNLGEPYVAAAVEKGIPLVIGAADSPFKTRDAFIGYNNTVLGNQTAEWVAELIDCKGSVGSIAINGANLTERTEAFNAHIVELCPDVVVYERASHDGSASSASATIDAYMVAHPDLSLLWFADGGAGQQVQTWKDKQEQWKEKGVPGVMFLAMDMPPATLQAVKDGVFVGSVGQDTYTEAYWGVMLLDALSKGQRVPDTLYLSAILVDKDNVDQFIEK